MSQPYRTAILEHARAPHRRGRLPSASHRGCGDNALCGDHLQIELGIEQGSLRDYAFEAEACAIVVATASMLGDALIGMPSAGLPARLDALEADLRRLLGQCEPPPDAILLQRLGELAEFAEMRALPRRHRCVTLALEAMRAALASGMNRGD